ncbi:MAG: hypothetical protein DRR19_01140 [Candidatus Parabeggiatoa sp. nov. 1]|nr:MAG: hypothetical protein DRR19_01140 [Gammaproteobacteria bacterium]
MNTLPISNSRATRAVKRIILLTLLSFLIAGCFAPAIVAEKNHRCQLVTKKLKLTLSEEGTDILTGTFSSHGCQTPECLLIALGAVAVSAASLIVSGSIVVIGNTIHWIEKQGTCEN